MNRIDRYLIRHVLFTTGIVALVLVSIYTFVIFVSDLGQTDHGHLGITGLAEYALLLVPANIYILLPLIALLGALLGIGGMAHENELVAIRGAGVSWYRLGLATVIAGVLLGALGFVLGSWLGPAGQRSADALKSGQAHGMHVRWLRDTHGVVRIQYVRDAKDVEGVTIYQLDDGRRITGIIRAASGHYGGAAWQLRDVERTRFGSGQVQVQHLPRLAWHGNITPSVLKLFILEDNSLSAQGLMRLVHYLHRNQLDAEKYEMLLWRKLIEPFTIVAMVLLAVPFAGTGRLRSAGVGQRLLAGIGVGVAFYIADKVAVSLGEVYQWSAPLSAAAATVILVLVGLWRLHRVR